VFVFPAIPVIDPSLDVLGSYRVPDYVTYIKIGGTLSQPSLEIYSDPALDPADVLAVVLFGQPVSKLAEGQRQSLASSGGQLVAGYAASGLANSLTEALNLDTLIVQTGENPEASGIGVGKYLNEKLYLFYYHHFGENAAEEFKLRYEIRKNFSIEAGQDEKGQGGIDIYYKHQ
jgi:translocation and assembly module TamB